MADTSNRAYTYPAATADTQIWTHIQTLAEDLDVDIQAIIDDLISTRVATATPVTSDSATFTGTESGSLGSVTAPLVSGEWYEVIFEGKMQSSVAGDVGLCRIRQASAVGTELQQELTYIDTTSTIGYPCKVRAELQAGATANVAFHITGQRNDGTGNVSFSAGATFPQQFYVNKIIRA